MKPARIILDPGNSIEMEWCWRDDWVTGFDSAYGLLSKFAKLNAMGARELAHLFIHRGCGQRTAIVRAPKVDLRSGSFFDLTELARVLRLGPEHLRHAFLLDHLTNSRRRSSVKAAAASPAARALAFTHHCFSSTCSPPARATARQSDHAARNVGHRYRTGSSRRCSRNRFAARSVMPIWRQRCAPLRRVRLECANRKPLGLQT